MRKMYFLVALAIACAANVSAQSYTETFDSNSLEWTERAYKNDQGNAIIKDGRMKITSNLIKVSTGGGNKEVYATSFETHCYAPISVSKPFTITSNVLVKRSEEFGIIFNFKDFGNYYAFMMTEEYVKFLRFENNNLVGTITQGVRWKKKFNRQNGQTWVLKSDGIKLEFIVNDEPIMSVRYMPLEYTGFGYYTYGDSEIYVDEVIFKQGL